MNSKTQMIQSARNLPPSAKGNPRFEVYFTDGTRAVTKSDVASLKQLLQPDNVAPNSVEVTYDRGKIVKVKSLGIID